MVRLSMVGIYLGAQKGRRGFKSEAAKKEHGLAIEYNSTSKPVSLITIKLTS